jgi:uncharacterized protein YukE
MAYGDPAGMRAEANVLRRYADEIDSRVARVTQRVHHVEFHGPAADRLRHRTELWRRNVRALADELRRAAAQLGTSASQVEAQQREERRREELRRQQQQQRR